MEQQSERKDPAAGSENEKQEASSVFRRKAVDRISSPEQLNEYIRVASPRMWAVLLAVIVFLAGAVVWGIFGHIESTVYGVAIADGGTCTLYVAQEKAALLKAGDPVRVGEAETTLVSVSPEPFAVPESFPEYARSVGGFALGEWVCSASVDVCELPDGIYPASVVEESISPLSLLTEKN